MNRSLRKNVAAAAMLLVPMGAALVALPASAQGYQHRVAEAAQDGKIRSMTLNSDAGLRPGSTLHMQVCGTPGARWATMSLGEGVRVALRERAPGEYVGSYTVRRGDHLDPTQLITVRAGWSERPVSLAFNYPASFQALAMGAGPAFARAEVNSFGMWPRDVDRLEPGTVVRFRMQGTPQGRAWVSIPGVERGVQLTERRPGAYEGSYTIRRNDDVDAFAQAVGTLRSGEQRVSIQLNGQPARNFSSGYGR